MLKGTLRTRCFCFRMATPHKQTKQAARAPQPMPASAGLPEVVDPSWLLKAFAVMVAVAVVCGYIVICAVFYVQQWQLVLHPSRTATHTPQQAVLQAEDVRFGDGLHGWWIASDSASDPAVLMLPSGDGDASDLLARARTLHEARLNVLLFDYRGYGASAGQHPAQSTMQQDSEAALGYLTGQRGASHVLVYGRGVGAGLGARLCAEHHELSALIAESPNGDFAPRAAADTRARLVPFRMLFHEDFPLAAPLHALDTPKLLVTYGGASPAVQQAGDPKMVVALSSSNDEANWRASLRRFLDTYVTR